MVRLAFLRLRTEFEVQCFLDSDDLLGPLAGDRADIQHDVLKNFWKTLKKRFPSVRRVVIKRNWDFLLPRQHNKRVS